MFNGAGPKPGRTQLPRQPASSGDGDEPPIDAWEVKDVREDVDERFARPILSPECEELRNLWIASCNGFLERQPSVGGEKPRPYAPNARIDGGLCKFTRHTFTPQWPKIVDAAVKSQVSFYELVYALFSSWTSHRMPDVRELVALENIKRAQRRMHDKRRLIQLSRQSEEAIFRMAVYNANLWIASPEEAQKHALRQLNIGLSPLFRYCVARLVNFDDIADTWRKAASAQFSRYPTVYREFWESLLPAELKHAG